MSLSVNVLRIGNFRRLLLGRCCGIMALQAQAVIVGWQVYSLTHDPFMLGLTGLVEAVPAIGCALFAGHLVDISRPYRIYLACIAALLLNTLMLFLLAGGVLHEGDSDVLPFIFLGIFISGVARSFVMPSTFSLLPQVVPRSEIPAASAWLSSGFQLAAITGPAVAGIIYGGYGARAGWAMPMALMLVAFVTILSMKGAPRQFRRDKTMREPAAKSIKAGWRFIWHNQALLSIMALDMFAVLFGGVVAILPAYADQVLHTNAQGLGILRAATAVGAIGTALYFALKPMKTIRAVNLLWVITGFGLCMIGFGLTTHFIVAFVMLALSGAFDSVSMVIRSTLMQLLIPEEMRGRVSSVNSMFIISSNEIGAFRAGTGAALLGLVPSILMGGVATLAVVAFTALKAPKLRALVVNADEARKDPA